jgi:hypothetical protein
VGKGIGITAYLITLAPSPPKVNISYLTTASVTGTRRLQPTMIIRCAAAIRRVARVRFTQCWLCFAIDYRCFVCRPGRKASFRIEPAKLTSDFIQRSIAILGAGRVCGIGPMFLMGAGSLSAPLFVFGHVIRFQWRQTRHRTPDDFSRRGCIARRFRR